MFASHGKKLCVQSKYKVLFVRSHLVINVKISKPPPIITAIFLHSNSRWYFFWDKRYMIALTATLVTRAEYAAPKSPQELMKNQVRGIFKADEMLWILAIDLVSLA